MDNIIKLIENDSFSGNDIIKAVGKNINIIIYPQLKKVKKLDDILEPYGCCVILYLTNKNYGHWVCLIKHNKNDIEFFDSYAMKPDEELEFIKENTRKKLGQVLPHLSYLLYESGYNIIYNNHKLQKMKDKTSTCGRHVAFRIIMRDLNIDQYAKLFKGKDADLLVTYLTAFVT